MQVTLSIKTENLIFFFFSLAFVILLNVLTDSRDIVSDYS